MAQAPYLATSIISLIDNLGGGEIMMVLVLLMVVVGPDRLPEVARKIGKGIAQARAQFSSMSDEVRQVVDDPAMQPLREIGEFAMRPRQKLSEIVRMAELDLNEDTAKKAAIDKSDGADEATAVRELPEPGQPPGEGAQLPANMDDKLAGQDVPVDVEVAAERSAEAERRRANQTEQADQTEQVTQTGQASGDQPENAAFGTRARPLGSVGSQQADPPSEEPTGTPIASTAFTVRGRSLGERLPTGDDASDAPETTADQVDPAS